MVGLSADTLVLVAGLFGVAIANYIGARSRVRSEAMRLFREELEALRAQNARLKSELTELNERIRVLEGILMRSGPEVEAAVRRLLEVKAS